MTISNVTIQLTGSGAFSGKQLQEDVTVTLPPELAQAGSPSSVTTSLILIDSKVYVKVSGVPGQEDKWYVMDVGQMAGGMEGSLFGVPGTNVTGPNQQFADAFTSREAGKETINGAATTKWDVDVDLPKLMQMLSAAGTPQSEQTTQVIANTKMMLHLWIGDSDMYIYREQVHMEIQVPQSGTTSSASGNLVMDITINFKDLGAAVAITAPPNATPISTAPTGTSSSLLFGMPMGMPIGMPGAMMPTGMPRTGAGDAGDNTMPLAGLALGLLFVAMGVLARRKALT
jgi:hypothetical protein